VPNDHACGEFAIVLGEGTQQLLARSRLDRFRENVRVE
jgi:hypothetical protein